MDSIKSALNKDFLGKLEFFNLKLCNKINYGYSGARKSLAKGNSLEFSDFKDYVVGDDIKRIDWNSYSRLDKLFVKIFAEEKQATINIFLDNSLSMDFGEGSQNKLWYSKLIAASIAYMGLKNADKVNFFTCNKSLHMARNNVSSKNMFHSVVKFLDEMTASNGTMLNQSIQEINKVALQQNLGSGVSYIISDFFSDDGFKESIRFLQSKRQEVVLVHVLSPKEISPDFTEACRLIDSETKIPQDIFMTAEVLNSYKKSFAAFCSEIKDVCKSRKATYIFAPTHVDIMTILSKV